MFDDTKGVIRIGKPKCIQYNGKYKRTTAQTIILTYAHN